jgi:WD40 repeat protein
MIGWFAVHRPWARNAGVLHSSAKMVSNMQGLYKPAAYLALAAALSVALASDSTPPKTAYVVYVQRFISPPHETIRRFKPTPDTTDVPTSAGDLLYDSEYDEGIREISLSPGGRYLLVADDEDWVATSLNDLRLIHLDTRRTEALTKDKAGYSDLRWSSDESLIGYVSNEGTSQGGGGAV